MIMQGVHLGSSIFSRDAGAMVVMVKLFSLMSSVKLNLKERHLRWGWHRYRSEHDAYPEIKWSFPWSEGWDRGMCFAFFFVAGTYQVTGDIGKWVTEWAIDRCGFVATFSNIQAYSLGNTRYGPHSLYPCGESFVITNCLLIIILHENAISKASSFYKDGDSLI